MAGRGLYSRKEREERFLGTPKYYRKIRAIKPEGYKFDERQFPLPAGVQKVGTRGETWGSSPWI